jgi:hypothetical protein
LVAGCDGMVGEFLTLRTIAARYGSSLCFLIHGRGLILCAKFVVCRANYVHYISRLMQVANRAGYVYDSGDGGQCM